MDFSFTVNILTTLTDNFVHRQLPVGVANTIRADCLSMAYYYWHQCKYLPPLISKNVIFESTCTHIWIAYNCLSTTTFVSIYMTLYLLHCQVRNSRMSPRLVPRPYSYSLGTNLSVSECMIQKANIHVDCVKKMPFYVSLWRPKGGLLQFLLTNQERNLVTSGEMHRGWGLPSEYRRILGN